MPTVHPFAKRAYAEALAGAGAVVAVPEWGSHVVERPLAQGRSDAMGVYPMQVFGPGADVAAGLARLAGRGLVSVVMVPDPLLCAASALARDFAVCRPFKAHHLVDLTSGPYAPSKHHREFIRRGLRRCRVERTTLADRLDDWRRLYAGLAARRGISGAADFSDAYVRMLAEEPALTAFAAFVDEACVGMSLWFAAEGVVYNHLNASDAAGYANSANYALYDVAIAHYGGQGVINLGGGAGYSGAEDGLTAFKRGFANGEVVSHICGAVLDPAAYADLSAGRAASDFFPAYRAPAREPAEA